MTYASSFIAVLTLFLVVSLHVFKPILANFFLEENDTKTLSLTYEFIAIIWPIFLFNGFNVLISVYLTSAEKALQSSLIATSRSLALPIFLVLLFSYFFSGHHFIYAIPLAEAFTFLLAIIFFNRYQPSKIIPNSIDKNEH